MQECNMEIIYLSLLALSACILLVQAAAETDVLESRNLKNVTFPLIQEGQRMTIIGGSTVTDPEKVRE